MRQSHADFLVVGSTPLARLLAGLLASPHGKTVALIAQSPLGYCLQHGMDLSVGALTRPESWALLAQAVPETGKLITRVGTRAAIARLDPILFADAETGKQALGHIRHMAAAHGLAAERTPANYLGKLREGVVLRDAMMLRRTVLEPALDNWLAEIGVRRLGPEASVQIEADGRAQCQLLDEAIAIGQTILADDSAILAHLAAPAWPALLHQQMASAILTQPVKPMAAPVMYQLDGGIMLHQQSEGGILAYGPGTGDQMAVALAPLLDKPGAFEQAGQSSAMRVITRDGAPAVGRVGGTGPDVLAGFGTLGAFLAPAIARWLCGVASATENAWFGARLVDRSPENGSVGDIGDRR